MKRGYLLLFALLYSTMGFSQMQAYEEGYSGQHKLSLDLITGLWGRLPATSEYGLIYNRNYHSKTEWSVKLAYSGMNYFLGRAASDSGGVLRDHVGVNGLSAGVSFYYFLGGPNLHRRWFTGLENNFAFSRYKDKNDKKEFFNLSKFSSSLLLGHCFYLTALGMEIDAFFGLGAAFRNYYWQEYKSDSQNEDEEVVNTSWGIGWGLELEPSAKWAVPVGFRIGYRF